jgi:hypothetical protein
VRAFTDGHTLLLITTANAINTVMLKPNFHFIRYIAPVASIVVPLLSAWGRKGLRKCRPRCWLNLHHALQALVGVRRVIPTC